MKLKTNLLIMTGLLAHALGSAAQTAAAHFDMSLQENGSIKELISGNAYPVTSQLPASTVSGPDGEALRFDGYSNYVKAGLPVSSFSKESLTVSVVLAAEAYPMMQTDAAEETPTYATICGNLDETAKGGFAFELSSQGDLRFRAGVSYGAGAIVTVLGSQKLPRGQWNLLTAVFNKGGNSVKLYLNGVEIGAKNAANSELNPSTADFFIGKDATDRKSGPFLLNTFCGAIDDIAVYNRVEVPAAYTPQVANFNYAASRYAQNLWRPQFHAMPSGSWTNETHGMTYSNGRYHVFFQKNANGPYMSRLHWGHLSSEDLCQWTEEPIAVYPGESFDIKGCWSGCVYEDGGDNYLLYTAVDNTKARIVQAKAKDNTLVVWGDKKVVIDGRPDGLSDDFRDPYYFEANGNKYIIVGTSKNNVGACTLHRWNGTTWSNDGTLFFQGSNASQHGRFWEMPNVTKMGDKWLFTCTPLETSQGVRTLCWVGTIGNDGKFTPDGEVQYLEMGGISRDGYGLLSPSIMNSSLFFDQGQSDPRVERTLHSSLLIGIVPDKLPAQNNYEMGWAHNYSLPREISIDDNGKLVQKPYSGLTALRGATTVTRELTLTGTESLAPVSGRQIELLGEFAATTGKCGFRFLKSGDNQATLTYDADTKQLTLDLTQMARMPNDAGSYQGTYHVTVPEPLTKLHVFVDASIADIFVNDKWAFSVRMFPTEANAVEAEVFATTATNVKVSAWTLNGSNPTGIKWPNSQSSNSQSSNSQMYDLQGRQLTGRPQKGFYIQDGRKYVAR